MSFVLLVFGNTALLLFILFCFRNPLVHHNMTKKLEFDWHIKVPDVLVNGCEFDMWTEEEGLESNCLFKVDEYGFFINWKKEGCVCTNRILFVLPLGSKINELLYILFNSVSYILSKDGDVLELCQVSDIRKGGISKVSSNQRQQ